ncbi:unnamed protein product [Bursaphelenchus xylophilus]|uniref:(pine wood nematode) hypothetical protein n=1 Tax=Bursaphelenchus xylophilus TaxID=6326 RepID=A0A1I7RHH4_BURXY|nr:unnamed protein product [Bursaphelenchus xylophilus]CAG9115753.1 unnamed protein product [Bursaphelenchus xylophilus]
MKWHHSNYFIIQGNIAMVTIAEEFKVIEFLGSGGFGNVYVVRKRSGYDKKRKYALKEISKDKVMDSKINMAGMKVERNVMMKADSPFIVKLYYAYQTPTTLNLVMDYIRGCDFYCFMERMGILGENFSVHLVRFYTSEMILALEYLHENLIIFRDLKPENIMVERNGHIKLIDFGHSRILDENTIKVYTSAGTPGYKAPELNNNQNGYSKSVDWWAMGIIMYEMIYERQPFDYHDENVDEKYLTQEIPFPTKPIDPQMNHLLCQLLQKTPEDRIDGFSQLQNHPFFSRTNWKTIQKRRIPPPLPFPLSRIMEMDLFPQDPIKMSSDINHGIFEDFDYTSPMIGKRGTKRSHD